MTFAPHVASGAGTGWGELTLTLHEDARSLVSALIDVRVVPRAREGGPLAMPPGVLALHGADRSSTLEALGARFGVPLHGDRGYLLAALRRDDGRADHEVTVENNVVLFARERHCTERGARAMARLRPGTRRFNGSFFDTALTAREAERALAFCYAFGTHFVAAVEAGDRLLQVFSYERHAFERMREAFTAAGDGVLRGIDALSLVRDFARPRFVAEAGHVVSQAGDPAVHEIRREGAWRDDASGAERIDAPLARGDAVRDRLLARLVACAPLAYELVPLDRFMEHFRAASFRRVVRGALFAVWGRDVTLPVPRLHERSWGSVFPGSADFGAPEGGAFDAYAARIDTEPAAHACADTALDRVTIGAHVVRFAPAADVALETHALAIGAAVIDAPQSTADAATLRVPPDANIAMVAAEMEGALLIARGEERTALLDGLRFRLLEEDAAGERPRVALDGDLHGAATDAASALYPLLLHALPAALECAPDEPARPLAFARLDALARALPPASTDAAHDLLVACARAAGALAARGGNPPQTQYAEIRADAVAIAVDGDLFARETAERDAHARSLPPAARAEAEAAHAAELGRRRRALSGPYDRLLVRSGHEAVVRRAVEDALDANAALVSSARAAIALERARVAAMLTYVVALQQAALGTRAAAVEPAPRVPSIAARAYTAMRYDALLAEDGSDGATLDGDG